MILNDLLTLETIAQVTVIKYSQFMVVRPLRRMSSLTAGVDRTNEHYSHFITSIELQHEYFCPVFWTPRCSQRIC